MKKLLAVLTLLISFLTVHAATTAAELQRGLFTCSRIEEPKFYDCMLEEIIKAYDRYVVYQNLSPLGRQILGQQLADLRFTRTKARQPEDNKTWTFLSFLNYELNTYDDLVEHGAKRAEKNTLA